MQDHPVPGPGPERTHASRLGLGAVGGLLLLLLLLVVGESGTRLEPEVTAPEPVAAATPGEEPTAPATDAGRPSPSPRPSPTAPTASATPAPEATTRPSPSPQSPPLAAGPRGDDAPVVVQGRVDRVIDGDTFELSNGTRVRLAITDTPEVHGGYETCGPEAHAFATSFLAGATVAVHRPAGAPVEDRYGRTVGEAVRVTDGASLNVALVAAGLATVDERFTAEDPDLAARLRTAAGDAADPTCEDHDAPPPAPEPAPAAGSGQHTGNVGGGYDCHPAYLECLPQVGDLNCGDIGHGVSLFGHSDPYGLDREGDRLGCESEPSWSSSRSYPYYG